MASIRQMRRGSWQAIVRRNGYRSSAPLIRDTMQSDGRVKCEPEIDGAVLWIAAQAKGAKLNLPPASVPGSICT